MKCRRLIICAFLVCIAGNVLAASRYFVNEDANAVDGIGDHLWVTATNWDANIVPTTADNAGVNAGDPNWYCVINNGDSAVTGGWFQVGIVAGDEGSNAHLIMNGGTL